MLHDPNRPDWKRGGPRPVRVHVWRPPRVQAPGAVVVVSHGTGGAARQMHWLTIPLATAGFLTLAVDHHGNNHIDGYLPEGFARWWERALDLSFALATVAPKLPRGACGAAGFSLGGYTAAALLGARIDSAAYARLLRGEVRAPPPPEYPSLRDDLNKCLTSTDVTAWINESGRNYSDERVACAYLVAPALGGLLARDSLASIKAPVVVGYTAGDDVEPPHENALVYAGTMPRAELRCLDDTAPHTAFFSEERRWAELRRHTASDAISFFTQCLSGTQDSL